MTLDRLLIRPVALTLKVLAVLLLGGVVVGAGVSVVSARHQVREARQRECAAELRALKSSAFVQRFVVPSDPCLAIQVVKQER
jgi:hypothetical protein